MFSATPDVQSGAAKCLTRLTLKVIFLGMTKVISWSYCEILQCQGVSQCWSLDDCQAHKLQRPNGWLGSFERKYCVLIYSEVFLKNNEPYFGKMTSNTSMLSGSFWWYMIVQECSLISVFPTTPDAQSAAAKRLTRFILKVIFSSIRWRIVNATVTPRRVALTCVQRVVKFCHTSSHAQHGRRTILIRFANAVHV